MAKRALFERFGTAVFALQFLSSCVSTTGQDTFEANGLKEMAPRYAEANALCKTKTLATAVAKCQNESEALIAPYVGQFIDLIELKKAKRLEIATRVDAHVISPEQGEVEKRQASVTIVTEARHRMIQSQAVETQRQAATNAAIASLIFGVAEVALVGAAVASQARAQSAPVICNTSGGYRGSPVTTVCN